MQIYDINPPGNIQPTNWWIKTYNPIPPMPDANQYASSRGVLSYRSASFMGAMSGIEGKGMRWLGPRADAYSINRGILPSFITMSRENLGWWSEDGKITWSKLGGENWDESLCMSRIESYWVNSFFHYWSDRSSDWLGRSHPSWNKSIRFSSKVVLLVLELV